jgi:AraC-like DNA-binding protein
MKFFYENKDLSVYAGYGTNLAFGAHLHNHVEMVYMIEGSTKTIVDSTEYIICTGDVLIVFPNKIHQYQKIDNEYYFASIFSPELCPEFKNIFKNKVPVSPVIKNASENKKIFPLIKDIVDTNMERAPFYDTIIKGYYLILLSELFQMTQFEEAVSSDGNTIKDILNYCSKNYTLDLQLDTISKALHISKYYISHLFSEKLQMGFNEYIGMLRISDACKLLTSQDMSITEVAYSVGFNSTRSFNRLFLKYTGMTPRQYKSNPEKSI